MSGTFSLSPRNPERTQWRTTLGGIADQMKHILITGELSDVQFAVGREYGDEKIFSAHKFVLGLGSDVFYTMFNGGLPETGNRPIDVPEILPQAFANMLKYLYTGTLDEELTAEDILQTIYCADKYNLPQLTDLCLHCVNTHFNADNCLLFLEKVKSAPHDCFAGLLEKCLAVVDAHGRDVVKAEQFSLIGQDTLAMILQRSTLAAEESIIYEAVEKWSREACQRGNLESSQINRRWVLGPALFFVRFPLLTDAQLISGPVASGLLLDSEVRGIYQFKYSHFGCQLPFPTEPREGTVLNVASGGAEFTYKEKVFVDVGSPDDLWVPALIVGIRGAEFAITRVGGETVEWYAMHKIVRASDILQKGQKITLYGEVRESDGTYVGCRAKDVHVVKYGLCGRSEWSGPLCDLRMSREQIAEWKSSNASQLAHVEFQRRLLNDKRW